MMNSAEQDSEGLGFGPSQTPSQNLIDVARVDRSIMVHGTLDDEGDERAYWHSRTPEERLEALELMRQILYGYDPATERLQRVLEIVELE
ncbi:MAG: hypothetical protein DCC65_09925 [Planctomycetota bacterium]|nr:MAG: hypothetical protein DCC65_09925 [Planctomycetota bacterium]